MNRGCDLEASGTIELYFYGELPPPEQHEVQRHIRACAACESALGDLSAIRQALAARRSIAAPPGGDWSGFMAALTASTSAPPLHPAAGRGATHWSHAGLVAAAALLALVTVGVLFAARSRQPPAPAPAVSASPIPAERPVDDAGFEALSEEHFERSKLVVLGLAAKDPDRTTSADWTYERRLATTLLSDTRMYRMAAEDRGLRSIADVMRDLELVLLETSFTDVGDPASLTQIQRLIQKRDLVQKMDSVAVSGL
jgi:hypothetical protein